MKKKHVFWGLALRQWHWFVAELIMAALLSGVTVKGGMMIADAIDGLLSGSALADRRFIITLLVLVPVGGAAAFFNSWFASVFSINIQTAFRGLAGVKIPDMEFAYFDENGSGSMMNRLVDDIAKAGTFFQEILPQFVIVVVTTVTVSWSFISIDIWLLLFALLLCPVVVVISDYVSKKISSLTRRHTQIWDRVTSEIYDRVQGIVVGRSFNLEEVSGRIFNKEIDTALETDYERNRISSHSWVLNRVVDWIPNIVMLVFALWRMTTGKITVGEMAYYILMVEKIIKPVSSIPMLFNEMKEVSVSIERLEEIMSEPGEKSGTYIGEISKGNAILDKDSGEDSVIEFDRITFGYSEGKTILNGIDFTIRAGENVAFVGPSGEGKSTIFKIMCGFYRGSDGVYRLCGRDFEEWNLCAARSMFSLVSQNVFLFPESIGDNIRYGRTDATREEIEEACRLANIHDFIMTLDDGYDTVVGERGARLSGGERQRISIARAFLKNAPILLLDEPTSAIDVGCEHLIKEAIERISKGKTVITIAHRLSTIENADRIMVLHNGAVVQSGTHEQLLDEDGLYRELYTMQVAAGKEKS